MADYYTHFSCLLDVGTPENAARALDLYNALADDNAAEDPMSYGETVITLPYVREKWSSMFDLLDVSVLTGDMYQVALTLRKAE